MSSKPFKRVSDHVIDSMLAEAEGSNSVLERLCEEVKMARSARASEVTGVAGRVVFQIVTLLVRPGSCVPFDMLRYDRCTPLREEDSNKMAAMMLLASGELSESERTVQVLRTSPNGGQPAVGRWASFGCQVIDVKRGWAL